MSMNDTTAAALSKVMNAERIGKNDVLIKPHSKILRNVLDLMKENKYIGAYEVIADGKGGYLKVNLIGGINKCGVIKPRFAVKIQNMEKYEKRYLLAKDFGIIMMSTTKGVISHKQAKKENVGGRLLAYCY